jgi:hypothetical protein
LAIRNPEVAFIDHPLRGPVITARDTGFSVRDIALRRHRVRLKNRRHLRASDQRDIADKAAEIGRWP